MTQFIAHRINTINDLKLISYDLGIEIDLRDKGDKLILAHDPFIDGCDFEEFLQNYKHKFIILNIKSERIEFKVIKLLKKYRVTEYFFLDSSYPMIHLLSKQGENNIAIRYSEFEPFNMVELNKNKVKWVWIDCFNQYPINKTTYKKIKEWGLKICLVSPELQGYDITKIDEFTEYLNNQGIVPDMICTKYYNIDLWIKKMKS